MQGRWCIATDKLISTRQMMASIKTLIAYVTVKKNVYRIYIIFFGWRGWGGLNLSTFFRNIFTAKLFRNFQGCLRVSGGDQALRQSCKLQNVAKFFIQKTQKSCFIYCFHNFRMDLGFIFIYVFIIGKFCPVFFRLFLESLHLF